MLSYDQAVETFKKWCEERGHVFDRPVRAESDCHDDGWELADRDSLLCYVTGDRDVLLPEEIRKDFQRELLMAETDDLAPT